MTLLNCAETPTSEDLRHLAVALDDMEQRTNQLRATMRDEYASESIRSVLRLLDDEEEDDDLAAWLGDDFDPEAFDIEVVNTRLRRT